MTSIRSLGQRIRDMADAEHEEQGGTVERKRSQHELEWPGYDSLDKDERVRFWRALPVPGTPARSVI